MDKSQLVQPEIQAFIRENENSDLPKLIMQKQNSALPIREIAEQIKSRKKAKTKLPTWYKTSGILYPASVSIEQSSSEATAEFKMRPFSGKSALDLTGGFGVDSYYLANKFNSVTYVENNPELADIAAYNFSVLGQDNIIIRSLTAEMFLAQNKGRFDLVYIDPDRRVGGKRARGFEDSQPDLLNLLPSILSVADKIMVKASPMLDISLAINQLKTVESVNVLAVANEVKDLLFILSNKPGSGQLIRSVNITTKGEQVLEYHLSDTFQEECVLRKLEKYLYEPNAAILKSGGYDHLCKPYNLQKLNRNTHLYTSKVVVNNFPGRAFKVIANVSYNKRQILPYLPSNKANISVRNFLDAPEQVKKKLGLKDGGDRYLFGYRDLNDKPMIAICKKN